jgi:hypothetical protein
MLSGYDSAGLGGALFLSNGIDLYDNANDDQVDVKAWRNLSGGIGFSNFYNTPSTGAWTFNNDLNVTNDLDVNGTMALGNNSTVDNSIILNVGGTFNGAGDVYGIREYGLNLNPANGSNVYFNYFSGSSVKDFGESIANTYGVFIDSLTQVGGG